MKTVTVTLNAAKDSDEVVKESDLMSKEAKLAFFKSIVKEHQAKYIKSNTGKKVLVDATTANIVIEVYNKVNQQNRSKLDKLSPLAVIGIVFKLLK